MGLPKWTEERTKQLEGMAGSTDTVITQVMVQEMADNLDTTTRSVASKLRKMDYEVEKVTQKSKSYSEDEEKELVAFVEDNPGKYTAAEIATYLYNDVDRGRSVHGKLLSMDLLHLVAKTPPKEVPHKYSEEEEAKILSLVNSGAFLEDIASDLGKAINSVRGKCLAMTKSHGINIPPQRDTKGKDKVDPFEELGDLTKLTVQEIADKTEKTARGVKSMLTIRKLKASDYDGAKRAEKIEQKRAAQ